jgi:hypothetical protein
MTLETLVRCAGLAQIVLALASLAIPAVLGWREHARRLPPLTRQVFWLWGAYIFSTHVAFGVVSLAWADRLVDGSALARAVAAFIAAWWGVRLAAQFVWLDRSAAPAGRIFLVAEIALVALFAALALVYAAVAL